MERRNTVVAGAAPPLNVTGPCAGHVDGVAGLRWALIWDRGTESIALRLGGWWMCWWRRMRNRRRRVRRREKSPQAKGEGGEWLGES